MKKIQLIILFVGFIILFLSVDITLTGAAINNNIKISNTPLFILSLFVFLGFCLYVSNKSLESLIIPTGTSDANEKRIETAMKSYIKTEKKPYILISGEIHRDHRGKPLRETQQYSIYKKLRKYYDVKPSDIIIEGKSKDTLENFIYSVKKLKSKGINHIKIATNPTQYWRFKLFEKEVKKNGLIDDSFLLEPLYTSESPKEFVYGVMAYVKDYFRIKFADSLDYASKRGISDVGSFFKKIFSK